MDNGESLIITFYSYKGGVGRSMAVANVACVLARDYGKKVLVVDWDLEAPGLHRFFGLEPKDLKPGLIDILEDYKGALSKDNAKGLPDPLVVIDKYITPAKSDFESGGSVSLIAAGRQDDTYAGRINAFSWEEFYKKWHGFGFFEYLKGELKQKADVVILDSRTGVTDIGGICTLQLPDVVVLLFALNEQNISGVESIARSIRERAVELAKRESPPEILVRPSRVEIYLEETLMQKWQEIAAVRLRDYVPQGEGGPLRYMAKRGIPYIGAYSFGETLAVMSNKLGPLAEAYESLASSVMDAAGLAASGRAAGARPAGGPSEWLGNVGRWYSAFLASRTALRRALLLSLLLLSGAFFLMAENYARLKVGRQEAQAAQEQAQESKALAESLRQQVKESEGRISELRKTVDALTSRGSGPVNVTDQPPSIDYCPKDDDELRKIESALGGLGYEMRRIPPRNDVPVNSVYFGSKVDPEDARNVAIRLLQAGIPIKGIYRFKNDSPKRDGTPRATLVEVIASRTNVARPTLTEEAVRNMTRFQTFDAENP